MCVKVVCFFFASFLLVQPAFAKNTFQYVNTDNIAVPIQDKLTLLLEAEFAFKNRARNFFYQHSEVGVEYSAAPWLDLELDYRQIQEKEDGQWITENRPFINAKIKGNLNDLQAYNRSRLEYRMIHAQDDYWRYRNETCLRYPVPGTNKKLKAFFRDDVFLDLAINRFNKNKIETGFVFGPVKNLKVEIFFIKESCPGKEKWQDTNGVGSKIKFEF